MSTSSVELSIQIDAAPSKVWAIFVDPDLTRRLGGTYVSTWEVGSSIAWRGMDAKIYTRGQILEIEAEHLLKHNLLFPLLPTAERPSTVHSTLTYRLVRNPTGTTLTAREEFPAPLSPEVYANAEQGWRISLESLKTVAEKY